MLTSINVLIPDASLEEDSVPAASPSIQRHRVSIDLIFMFIQKKCFIPLNISGAVKNIDYENMQIITLLYQELYW